MQSGPGAPCGAHPMDGVGVGEQTDFATGDNAMSSYLFHSLLLLWEVLP